jgi:membrane protein implicated in regulation of membrane protease activity
MYVIWFVAALALLVLELASTTFFSIFLAIGAFAAGLLAFVVPTSPIWAQAVVAIAVAMAGVVLVRPTAARRLRRSGPGPETPGVHGGLVGQRVLALDEIGDNLHPGHVRLVGETWLAYSADGRPIPVGAPVVVEAVRGTTLSVRPAEGSLASADGSATSEA